MGTEPLFSNEMIEVWCDGCAEKLVVIPRRDLNNLSLYHYCEDCASNGN